MAHALLLDQPALDGFCPVAEAVHQLAHHAGAEQRGAVYTRIEVVDFMLDLAGYTPDQPLHRLRLLEPSFGGGEFLLAAVRRLLMAARSAGAYAAVDLAHCIQAVELHHDTFASTRLRLLALLTESGLPPAECARLCSAWLQSGDFLLQALPGRFDVIVGNPPYVRQELLAPALLAQYRKLYRTLYDRADLYVPFIERSLSLLAPGGQLVFICADRWLKNKYGGPLRAMVMAGFHLRAYVNMVDTPAFDSTVQAYPAITLIENTPSAATLVAEQPALDPTTLASLAAALRADAACPALGVSRVEHIGSGSEPWVLGDSAQRALLRRLEANFPTLEGAGCKVGIGVATGADAAYIAPMHELDVEPSRKLALATTKDIASGELRWHGLGVINPFEDDGQLADLSRYPRLRAHLERHRPQIAARHVARKNPANWYRTIDRITPALRTRPKLLIPDIKGSAHVVYDEGRFYPHHNLYFVLSDTWDLRALQAVLLSGIARHCVAAYSTTLRGGFLRFQAQYLRRIRLPHWHDVPPALRQRLIQAATTQNRHACHQAACELYDLTPAEAALLAQD